MITKELEHDYNKLLKRNYWKKKWKNLKLQDFFLKNNQNTVNNSLRNNSLSNKIQSHLTNSNII